MPSRKADQAHIEGEVWIPVPGFENTYACSNMGRVKSLDRVVNKRDGRNVKMNGRILNPTNDKEGYLKVIFSINGNHTSLRVNRIVALAFHGPNELGTNHKDGNKKNNRPDNLEYATQKENVQHYLKNGLKKNFAPGGKPAIPIILFDVYKREEIPFNSVKECAEHFNADPSSIYRHINVKGYLFKRKYVIQYA